jgi:hypothetical protein
MDNFIHTLLDESIIEYILTKSLIFDGMDENDKQMIEFFIKSDKEINFINVKSAFIVLFLIEIGYVIKYSDFNYSFDVDQHTIVKNKTIIT